VIGECLHNIQKLGGQLVSVTTYGLITDLEYLENKLLSISKKDTVLFNNYRHLRQEISGFKKL
jgi:hypothetical protein